MKQKISILILMICFSLFSYSQTIGDYIDVLYLKNGSKIKGIIVEQVPGKTVKIETRDGSQYVYTTNEIEKFTREEIENKSTGESNKVKYMDNFRKKRKGYFANIDVLFNSAGSGLRLTHGYRFGRFGNIGLAMGIESVNSNFYYGNNFPALSLNLVYSGEILDKRITPFYQIEAGYGFSLNKFGQNNVDFYEIEDEDYLYYNGGENRTNYGGPMVGLALGVKFHTKKKIFYRLAFDAKINSNFSDVTSYYPNDPLSSYVESYTYKDFSATPGIGIRFGIGF